MFIEPYHHIRRYAVLCFASRNHREVYESFDNLRKWFLMDFESWIYFSKSWDFMLEDIIKNIQYDIVCLGLPNFFTEKSICSINKPNSAYVFLLLSGIEMRKNSFSTFHPSHHIICSDRQKGKKHQAFRRLSE